MFCNFLHRLLSHHNRRKYKAANPARLNVEILMKLRDESFIGLSDAMLTRPKFDSFDFLTSFQFKLIKVLLTKGHRSSYSVNIEHRLCY